MIRWPIQSQGDGTPNTIKNVPSNNHASFDVHNVNVENSEENIKRNLRFYKEKSLNQFLHFPNQYLTGEFLLSVVLGQCKTI